MLCVYVSDRPHIDSPQSEIGTPEQAPPHVDLGKGSPVGKVFQRQDSGNSESEGRLSYRHLNSQIRFGIPVFTLLPVFGYLLVYNVPAHKTELHCEHGVTLLFLFLFLLLLILRKKRVKYLSFFV